VAVGRVQTGHGTAGEANDERVGGEGFEAEDARFGRGERVHQEAQLGGHGVDDGRSVLESVEGVVDPLVVGEEGAEGDEAGDARERRGGGAEAEAARGGALDGLRASMAIAALASEHVAAHLLGARRGEGRGHSKRRHDLCRALFQAASASKKNRSAGDGHRKGAKRTFSMCAAGAKRRLRRRCPRGGSPTGRASSASASGGGTKCRA
jgi:hypothetical protein